METEKYTKIFGNSFLKSSLILGTKIDRCDDQQEIDDAIKHLDDEMFERLGMTFPIQQFSSKSKNTNQMISDTLLNLSKLPSFSNDAIA